MLDGDRLRAIGGCKHCCDRFRHLIVYSPIGDLEKARIGRANPFEWLIGDMFEHAAVADGGDDPDRSDVGMRRRREPRAEEKSSENCKNYAEGTFPPLAS